MVVKLDKEGRELEEVSKDMWEGVLWKPELGNSVLKDQFPKWCGDECSYWHTSYLSRKPREFSCKFFLAGVNFYRFNAKKLAIYCVFCRNNAKNWQFSVFFVVIYAFFRCKFYSPKMLFV